MRRISLKQQILCRTAMDLDIPPANPEEPPGDHDTNIQSLPEDCLGLILDHLDPVSVTQLERTSRHMHAIIHTHQYWRRALKKMIVKHPYLEEFVDVDLLERQDLLQQSVRNSFKLKYRDVAKDLNNYWKKNDRFRPLTIRNGQYFCEKDERQKVVSMKVTGSCFITVLGPRTRSDLAVYTIKVYDRHCKRKINEISNLIDKPEYLVFSPKYNTLVAKAHETCPSMPDTLNIWTLESQSDTFLRAYHLKSSGLGARCTALVLKEDVYFGSLRKDCVVMVPTR